METNQFIKRIVETGQVKIFGEIHNIANPWFRGTKRDNSWVAFRLPYQVDKKSFKETCIKNNFVDLSGPWKTEEESLRRLRG